MTARDGRVTSLAEWRAAHGQPVGPPATTESTARDYGAARQAMGAEVVIGADGPTIIWYGQDPDELMLLAVTLLDGARAARNGDDINAVAQQEWQRRGGRPDFD